MGRPSTTAPEDDTATKVGPAPERAYDAQHASSGRSITIAVPLDALGPLTVTAPAPARGSGRAGPAWGARCEAQMTADPESERPMHTTPDVARQLDARAAAGKPCP